MTSGPHCATLAGHVLVGAAFDAREQLLVGDAFFLGPFVDRQVEAEHARELLLQARRVPLLGIGVLRHVLGDQILDHRVAHVGDGRRPPSRPSSVRCAGRR